MNWDEITLTDMVAVIDELEASSTPDDLFKRLRKFFDTLGFDEIGIGQLVNPASVDSHIESLFWTDFPVDFMERWIDSRLVYQ